jgi:iron(III) transport system substrate-binding protein
MEYPVNPKVKPDDLVASWGEFKGDELNVALAGQLQTQAIKLMDRAGYR